MKPYNSIFLKPRQLMFLERIDYQSAYLKILRIKERLAEFYPDEISELLSNSQISNVDYAKYYQIDLNDLQTALKSENLLLVKPSDLIFLEGLNNIKTASFRYSNYLIKLNKNFTNCKLSVNEYASLNNTSVEQVLLLFLENEAEELIRNQFGEL